MRGRNRKASTVRKLSATERAWLAAVLDCEGSIVLTATRGYEYFYVSIANTNVELLERVELLIGDGKIYPHNTSKLGRKPCFVYVLTKADSVAALVGQLAPMLIEKRGKAQELLRRARLV